MEKEHITNDKLRNLLKKSCKEAGSQRKWAMENDFSAAYVGDVLKGNRDPGDKIGKALGYKKVNGWVLDKKKD